MKGKRIVSILCLLIAAALIFAGCGAENEPLAGSENGGSVSSGQGGEEQSSESSQASAAQRPTAGGVPVEIYDLCVEYPEGMTENEYNGMLGVYNYYTAAGTDLNICVSGLSADFELDAYIAKSVLASNSGVGALSDRVINGTTWRASDNGKKLYMAAATDDAVYEVVLTRGSNAAEYEKMEDMVLETLWLK
ncbi:MAG: hypothetical protein IKZ81_06680 [Clostridia bacterium]|nr:hypothetical protein [Clostridia bacterium]